MKLKNIGKDNEFLIITGTVHIGYGEDKQSVPFKSSYWSNVNGGGGTDFKWKRDTKGEYGSVLVEFGDELLKFKKDFLDKFHSCSNEVLPFLYLFPFSFDLGLYLPKNTNFCKNSFYKLFNTSNSII